MPGGEPKESGRAEPKESGRSGEPKESGRGSIGSPFGGGAGWVVVAFVSPVGINVPDLAVRMLGGSASSDALGPATPLGDQAVLAVDQARKRAKAQEEDRLLAEKYRTLLRTGQVGKRSEVS
jgi:hypothetical protein